MIDVLHKRQYGLMKCNILTFKAEPMTDIESREKESWVLSCIWNHKEVMTLLTKNTYVFLLSIR